MTAPRTSSNIFTVKGLEIKNFAPLSLANFLIGGAASVVIKPKVTSLPASRSAEGTARSGQ